MANAFLFPGQGAQFVGMGKDLYENNNRAREVFERADDILNFKISEIVFEGPEEKLNATDMQQPAIFVMSVACLESMRDSEKFGEVNPDYIAGLSLGEYTAYHAAGSIDFESALKLVSARGKFMQEAAEMTDSSMVSIIGLNDDKVLELCEQAREGQTLVAANFNCPGQVVVSGDLQACQRITTLAENAEAMKVIKLDVAGAFHSPLMAPAAEKLNKMLDETHFTEPKVPVITNVDTNMPKNPDEIKASFSRQLTSSTYWAKSMNKLLELGVDNFFEIGPKRTLSGFLKRISRRTKVQSISSLSDIQ